MLRSLLRSTATATATASAVAAAALAATASATVAPPAHAAAAASSRTADDAPRQDRYVERAAHFVSTLCDLSTLLLSRTECERQAEILDKARREPSSVDQAALSRAQRVVAATVHPETHEVIPAPFRFQAFAPANLVICGGLLWASNHSLLASAVWQWINASYSFAVNYANRSSGSPPVERLAFAYAGATASAVGIATGLQRLGNRLKASGRLVQLTVPTIGVIVGSVVNLLLTRSGELEEGVVVYDENGRELGRSRVAAQLGLAQCSGTRVAWTIALLTLAPVGARLATKALPRHAGAVATGAVEQLATFVVIFLSVPLCIAIFPQTASMEASWLEAGVVADPIERVYFNKGL